MKKLEGKVAVITGGNSGIGLATAQRFVSEGAYVFITGRRQSEVDAAVKQIGKDVTGVQGDVSKLADLDRLYADVKRQKGHVNILFANAGLGEFAPLEAITESHFYKTFSVNVKGLLFTVQKALPLFRNGGSIILNASTAASKAAGGSSVYGATKAAVRSFARSWTVELKDRKIRVNAISPGPIDTPGLRGFVSGLAQSEEQILVSAIPMERMGSPDEVAKVVSFLASDDSSFVTGSELCRWRYGTNLSELCSSIISNLVSCFLSFVIRFASIACLFNPLPSRDRISVKIMCLTTTIYPTQPITKN